ncbi:MAG TPA: M20/M25/M40 family metallo-hydrolase [Candidatus Saccharimonadales bacterium]|nr:M20/M25/M40 family metallo-hydrolase [Candidatus Saccharimonadales bacterium]
MTAINPQQLESILKRDLPLGLELLRRMVEINSFSTNREGVNRLGALTAEAFALFGFQSKFVASTNTSYGDHLVLTKKGTSTKTVGLITHLDTVFPPEEEQRNQFFWRPEGNRIYGPGTMDIKGGTLMIYLVLKALKETAPALFESITWKVLANSSEEVLSHDFGALCLRELGTDTLGALVFECEGRVGTTAALVVARKGRATFRVTVEGRAAHAGGRHHHGANAIVQMALTLQRIATFTDYERELTFNIGTVSGGTVINRVPHQAVAELEMRAFDSPIYNSGKQLLLALNGPGEIKAADDGYETQVKVEVLHESPPWPRNEKSDKLFAVFQETARSLGHIVVPQQRGGLSDGNLICHAVPTLDGLGPWGENDHCSERTPDGSKDQEYVEVSSFIPKAMLNVISILKLCQ